MEKFIEWSVSELKKRGLFIFFPKLENEIKNYPKILNEASKENDFSLIQEVGLRHQYFQFNVILPGEVESYDVGWSIDTAKVWDKTINHIPVNHPFVCSDNRNLNLARVKDYIRAKEIKPVLAIHFIPLASFVIIDGNHRFEAARIRGDIFIPAIILEPSEHIPTIVSLEMRQKFLIHHNLGMLLSFAHNPKMFLDITTDATRPERAFYPFNKGIRFSYLRKNMFIIWNALFNRS